jgi:hypothetical protein
MRVETHHAGSETRILPGIFFRLACRSDGEEET